MPKVVIFWTARDDVKPWILSELSSGRLRQGWGPSGTSLTRSGRRLSYAEQAEWIRNFQAAARKQWDWNPTIEEARTRFEILTRMLPLDRGDLVLVPEMPRDDTFVVAQITDGYDSDDGNTRRKDFCHMLRVDKDSMRVYGYRSSPEAVDVAAKLHHRRSAVNSVNDAAYRDRICALYQSDAPFEKV